MTTFKELAEVWIASREHYSGSLGRITASTPLSAALLYRATR